MRAWERISSGSTGRPAAATTKATTSSPQPGRRDSDHGGALDRRVLLERQLDLPRVDVEAAGDDQLLEPAGDREVSVARIDPADIPGPKPTPGRKLSAVAPSSRQ